MSKDSEEFDLEDHIRGTLYGNCVGDAIGLLTEFMEKPKVKQVKALSNILYVFTYLYNVQILAAPPTHKLKHSLPRKSFCTPWNDHVISWCTDYFPAQIPNIMIQLPHPRPPPPPIKILTVLGLFYLKLDDPEEQVHKSPLISLTQNSFLGTKATTIGCF